MDKFIGIKVVEAEPMDSITAVNLGYARIGSKYSGEGYHVIYNDNYHSWSPKKVFEEAYLKLDKANKDKMVEILNKHIDEQG